MKRPSLLLLSALLLSPLRADDAPTAAGPANPGFEDGTAGWKFGPAPQVRLDAQAAHGGKLGMRLVSDGQVKASATSDRFPAVPGRLCRFSFWGRVVSGGGVSAVIRFYDASGKAMAAGRKQATLEGVIPWKPYQTAGMVPAGAAQAEVSLVTWRAVTADFDDLRVDFEAPRIEPPWTPSYKLSPNDPRLTDADVVGPDGIVYPDWSQAGVPGGIPPAGSGTVAVPAREFAGKEGTDIADALEAACRKAGVAGGGVVELPAGTFFLDHPVFVTASGVVVRGASRDATKLLFRYRVPYGQLRLFPADGRVGAGGGLEIHADPKGLHALHVKAEGKALSDMVQGVHWGNTFSMRLQGDALLQRLGAGPHRLEATAEYADGESFSATFDVTVSAQPGGLPLNGQLGVITFSGAGRAPGSAPLLLQKDGLRGARQLALPASHGLKPGDRIQIEAPATERWNRETGNVCPWGTYRANQYRVVAVDGGLVSVDQPLRLVFPVVDGAFAQKISVIDGDGLEDLTIENDVVTKELVGDPEKADSGWYPIEDLWIDGVVFSHAWGGWVRGVRVMKAGRNSLYFMNSKFCEARDSEFDDALFKGRGGTAYLGCERAFDCLFDSVTTHALRHAPDVQWGSAGNVFRASKFYDSDAQWHAGWTNENLFEDNLIVSVLGNGGYGFGLYATAPTDGAHGPEGPRNVVYGNDVSSPKDALTMGGSNEGWIVAYNRFHVAEGRAVFGGEGSFDHVIRGNVFILDKPSDPAVLFAAPSCTGIELTGNRFYGPVKTIAGFENGVGALAKDDDNTVEKMADVPAPVPPVPSIFLWEKEHRK